MPENNKNGAGGRRFFPRRGKSASNSTAKNSESVVLEETGLYGKIELDADKLVGSITELMEQPEEEPAKSTQKPASKSRSGSKSGKKTSSAKQQSGKEEKTAQTAAPKSEKRRGRPRKKSVAEESQPVVPAPVQVSAPAQPAARKSGRRTRQKEDALASVRIIPLGGLGEIGKNMTVIETPQDIVIIDCGLAFPDDDMPGKMCIRDRPGAGRACWRRDRKGS